MTDHHPADEEPYQDTDTQTTRTPTGRRRRKPRRHARRKPGATNTTAVNDFIRRTVEAAPDLTPAQLQHLRDLLPPMTDT